MGELAGRKARAEAAAGGPWFKAAGGENELRLGPPWPGSKWPFKEADRHMVKVGGILRPFTCGKMTRRTCYTCDSVVPRLQASVEDGNDEDQEILAEVRAQHGIFANVLDFTDEAQLSKGWQVWAFSNKRYNQILSYFSDPDYGDISNPETGTNVRLIRTGKDRATKYDFFAKRNSTSLPPEFLEGLIDLDELLAPISDEEQIAIIQEAYQIPPDDDFLEDPYAARGEPDAEAEPGTEVPAEGEEGAQSSEEYEDVQPEGGAESGDEGEPESIPPEGDFEQVEAPTDGKRTAIVTLGDLSGVQRKKALLEEAQASACFGKFFKDTSEVCEACDAMVECAVKSPQVDARAPAVPARSPAAARRPAPTPARAPAHAPIRTAAPARPVARPATRPVSRPATTRRR